MSIIRDITLKAEKFFGQEEILLFVGARQAGKTTILRQLEKKLKEKEKNIFFLNLEDLEYLSLLNKTPKNIFKIFPINLNVKNYIFIDEVQYLKNPSNFLKYLFDEYKGKIKLIVSGSSAFYLDKKFNDSLAGRKKIFYVSALNFREFLRFKKEYNLEKKDFKQLSLREKEQISIFYREFMIFGGYPRVVLAESYEEKEDILRELAFSYIKKDIYESNIKQEENFYRLFKILASQIGNLFNSSELANTLDVSKTAIDNYIYVMRKSFHIAFLKPFYRNTRKELTKMPKIYFFDLGLRNFFVNNLKNFEARDDKGELLENAVFIQLRDFYEKDKLKFWRTISKNEVDFILDEQEALEVKVNPKNFKKSKYKKFFELYPEIKLSIVSLDKQENEICGHKIIDIWDCDQYNRFK